MSEIRRFLAASTKIDVQKKWEKRLSKMQCFFYAPLNKFGDLTDHVTGVTGNSYSFANALPNDNLTWSEENQCYLLDTNTGGQNALTFHMTNLSERLTGNNMTCVVTIKRPIDQNKFCYTFGIGRADAGRNKNGWSLYNWLNRISLPTSRFITLFTIIDYGNRECKLYADNSFIGRYSIASSWNGFKPNWQASWYNYITINGTYGASQSDSSYGGCAYFKECAMFNKVLTLDEISKIVAHNNV